MRRRAGCLLLLIACLLGAPAAGAAPPTVTEDGYLTMRDSIRGTGCSSGGHDLFEPAQAEDGAEAVEWAARQPWSNDDVGMASGLAAEVV